MEKKLNNKAIIIAAVALGAILAGIGIGGIVFSESVQSLEGEKQQLG